ncbi:MAG: LPS export ABC transporter periplasmic protein LptC [Candidatus Omnitrophota bacterium]|jgi:LPS export ABC transporter protein LptC
MTKKVLLAFVAFALIYAGVIHLQVVMTTRVANKAPGGGEAEKPSHKVYSFSFTKYGADGAKEIEIEGDSADIFTQNVLLMNVVAKAYAEETPVTITADKGNYDKQANEVHLKQNVVATTQDGTRLLTDELDIDPAKRMLATEANAEVTKDNINIEGKGATGDSNLKKVKFKKNVTVVIQDPDNKASGPTVITCDGPLLIDYDQNIAHFKDNVVAEDTRGKLGADAMDVFYNKTSRRVSKIIATGHVVIENPDGNKTYSDNVIYLADEGKVILGGDTEALYFESQQGKPQELF